MSDGIEGALRNRLSLWTEDVSRVRRANQEGRKPCPLCNKTDFTFIRDYGLERYLKSCEVWCSKKKDGCEWRGKLGGFEQHLKDDCPLTKVSCPLAVRWSCFAKTCQST